MFRDLSWLALTPGCAEEPPTLSAITSYLKIYWEQQCCKQVKALNNCSFFQIQLSSCHFHPQALSSFSRNSRSGEKHSTASRVFPYTSIVLYRFLRALQQNRAQLRLLYLLINSLLRSSSRNKKGRERRLSERHWDFLLSMLQWKGNWASINLIVIIC